MIVNKIKQCILRVILGSNYSSETYAQYLRNAGIKVGERTFFYDPRSTQVDITRPWLVSIGNDVQITRGVTILTHGYDWSVLKGVYGDVLGSAGAVKIGNNVFIGANSTILKGVHIGNNVIIGAGSLVNKSIPDNVVVAGNPARVIMSLDEYYEKRKKAQYTEAAELVREYRNRYGIEPDDNALREFFWLFSNDETKLPDAWREVNQLVGNGESTSEKFKDHEIMFKSKEEFLSSIR